MGTFEEYQKRWESAFIAAGHAFKMNDDEDGGDIDWFAVSGGMHNGPECTKCGWSCCQHCTEIANIPACTA